MQWQGPWYFPGEYKCCGTGLAGITGQGVTLIDWIVNVIHSF